LTEDDALAVQRIRAKCEALRFDLADAVGVALADRDTTDQILTHDQGDFRAVEPLTAGMMKTFRILSSDL
jgi:predicted nucleic acid-binding protein